MKLPMKKKGESKAHYARRCHWAGCKHTAIARRLGWTTGQVRKAIFGE